MLKDLTMTKILRHFIESVKLLHPLKFEKESQSQDLYQVENVIDFQYARLYNAMESDPSFKEYVLALLSNPGYREMQIDEYYAVMKPMFHTG
jgi:hypothetical protein